MAADGSIVVEIDMNASEADKKLKQLQDKIEKMEGAISGEESKRGPLVKELDSITQKAGEASLQIQKMKTELAEAEYNMSPEGTQGFGTPIEEFQRYQEIIATYPAKIKAQEEEYQKLNAQSDALTKKVSVYDEKLNKAQTKLGQMKEEAGGLAQKTAQAGIDSNKMASALERAQKGATRFSLRLREVVRSALVFTLISQSLASFRSWMGKVIKTNAEATASIARLKGALLTLAQPLVEVIIPAFTVFVNVLADLLSFIAVIISALFGSTAKESANAAKNLNSETNAMNNLGDAAKKAENSLAGFDEINKLVSENAGNGTGISETILPDFSAAKDLPEALKNLAADIALKITSLKFSWEEGDFKNKDIWIVALSGILGAIIGAMFGGITGSVIGLILGLSIGVVSCTFLDKTSNPDMYKGIFIVVLGAILGAILGAMFGGLVGGVIGLLLGATISIIALEFAKGETSTWDTNDTIIVVLSAILGAILGAVFGGLAGGVIGLLLGALISFIAIKFNEGKFSKSEAIASLRIAIFAILGAILGTMFGGFAGGVVGLILGATVGFASVAFDEKLGAQVQAMASRALKVALTTIIGALIGAVFGGGVFGGIVGGIIGLAFGLAVTLDKATIKNDTKFKGPTGVKHGGGFSSRATTRSTLSAQLHNLPLIAPKDIPALAQGAVIPPNREFMAVLGDQTSGNNIEAPENLIRKIVREEAGSNNTTTALLQSILDAVREGKILMVDNKVLARVAVKGINSLTQSAGKSVLHL